LSTNSRNDIVTISKRLGHAEPDITLRIYAHLFHQTIESIGKKTRWRFRACDYQTLLGNAIVPGNKPILVQLQ
jgi:hypothetical protein